MVTDPRNIAFIDVCHELGLRAAQHPSDTQSMIDAVLHQFTTFDSVEGEADWEGVFCAWSTLLDAIEKAHDNGKKKKVARLLKGRFDLVEQYGFRVEVTGMPASGSEH